MGMREEREHDDVTGGRRALVRRIVLAHLRERPDYYTRLRRCMRNPARSRAQQRLFGAALGCKRSGYRRCASAAVRRLARLHEATLREFARTKHARLPRRAPVRLARKRRSAKKRRRAA